MRAALHSIVIAAMLLLTFCAGDEERAIRHLVIAELMQRERLPESHIEIQSVHFVSAQEALVTAKVLGHGGRAATWRKVRCDLEREGGRWAVREIRQE